ncbi:NCS2 family permease [Salmonella enterica subsp. enterica serovar Schwarzengrund]|nr:NCS2 family permease [Salmonella enterica]EKB0023106.1 NCS2 family permease [Salmonella enterica subsp. enterica serovar Schwarzengrund]
MSQQHTTQASGQGMLERVFKLREHGTTARTEVIAGFTTFLTMVYIVFVNPQILGVAGMDTSAVFVTTCLIAAFGSILMGLFANLPVALAPAMGLNAFFAFVVVQAMGLPWQVGMGAIFWGAVGLLLLTIFRVRYWMIANIPVSLRVGITSGIGLFIGMMGLKNAGVIVANPETLVSIGNLTSHSVLLGVLGFFIIAILASRNIHAAVLVSIIVTTLLGWMMGDVHYNGIVSAPPSVTSVVGHVDLAGSFNLGLAGVIFSFMLVNLFDSSGTLIGVLMTSSLARVNWQDLTESVPAFITAVMMPFSFSITEGIALGFISYCVMKIGTGRLRDLSPCVVIVALLFVLKIVFIDAH